MRGFRHGLVAALAVVFLAGGLVFFPRRPPDPIHEVGSPRNSLVGVPSGLESKPENTAAVPVSLPPSRKPSRNPRAAFQKLLEALRSGDREKIKKAQEELLAEILPEPVPDDENAAVIYRKAFEKLVTASEEEQAALDTLNEEEEPTPEQKELVRAYLSKNKEALVLVREAASRPRCNFDLDYSAGFRMEIPHVSKLIHISKLLLTQATFSEGLGRAEIMRTADRVAEATAEEPSLVSQLVRIVGHGIGKETFELGLQASLSEDALLEIISEACPERTEGGVERAFFGEICFVTKWLTSEDVSEWESVAPTLRRPDDPLTVHDITYYADTLADFMELRKKSYYEVRDQLDQFEMEKVEKGPWYAQYSKLLMPGWSKVARAEAETRATFEMRQMAAALEIYRSRNGSYPASLDALQGILPAVPIDPFTGRPYSYQRETWGFVLSSPGSVGVEEYDDIVFKVRKENR